MSSHREYLAHLHVLENQAKAAKRGGWGYDAAVKYWELIANKLCKAGWSLGWVSAVDSKGERSGLQLRIAATESGSLCARLKKLTAFIELERQVLTVTFYLESVHAYS